MKQNIHPKNYRTILFYDGSANEDWFTRSCADMHGRTMVWRDGKEYPLLSLDASSALYPMYTGKRHNVNVEGRASRFGQCYQSMMSASRKDR